MLTTIACAVEAPEDEAAPLALRVHELRQQARLEEARRLFDKATELYRATPRDPQSEADLHRHSGFVDLVSGDGAGAIGHFRQSFELRQEAGFRDEIMFSAITLGLVRTAFYLGQARDTEGDGCGARELHERSLEIATGIGYESFVGAGRRTLSTRWLARSVRSLPSPLPEERGPEVRAASPTL